MKLIHISFIAVATLFTISTTAAQSQKKITQTVEINGNCGMCKKTIEEAANTKGAKLTWDPKSQSATLTLDPKKTSVDEVLQNVAKAGYDNQSYSAPENVYDNLHGCCQYERAKELAPVVSSN